MTVQERQPKNIESNYLTTKEVARLLKVDGDTVRRWCRVGIIGNIRLPGGGYRIKRESFNQMLNQ